MKSDILEELFSSYYNDALLYALSLTRDRHLAEELVSDAFFKALKSADDSIAAFKPWLLAVLRNDYVSHLRRYSRRAELHEQIPDSEEELLEALLRDEEYRALYHAIGLLPDKHREVITLFYFENLPVREIARVVGKSETNVKVTLCRAREKLKEFLEAAV